MRPARLEDKRAVAELHCLEKSLPLDACIDLFHREFTICASEPEKRTYLLALSDQQLVGYAGARYYDQNKHENMYGTANLLPTGWYLRGIKIHPEWRRRGLARTMTTKRLEWLGARSDHALVFLDDENKVTLPMYFELGFIEVSRGWTFCDPHRVAKNTTGILLRKSIGDPKPCP
ncbi:MAG: GNAT family N-acetyltransferase [Oligoflexales bacterium]